MTWTDFPDPSPQPNDTTRARGPARRWLNYAGMTRVGEIRDQSQSPGIASFSPNTTLELGPGAKRSGNHGLRHISIWGRVMSVIVIMRLAHWQGQLTENNKISIKLSRIVNHCPGGIICMRIVVKRVSSFTLNHHRPLWRHKWSLKQRTFSLLMGNYGGKGTYR